jgi:hypothetical protein
VLLMSSMPACWGSKMCDSITSAAIRYSALQVTQVGNQDSTRQVIICTRGPCKYAMYGGWPLLLLLMMMMIL